MLRAGRAKLASRAESPVCSDRLRAKTPSREGCAFYPLSALFPSSTSKTPNYSLAREVQSSTLIVTPSTRGEEIKTAGGNIPLRFLFPAVLWDG